MRETNTNSKLEPQQLPNKQNKLKASRWTLIARSRARRRRLPMSPKTKSYPSSRRRGGIALPRPLLHGSHCLLELLQQFRCLWVFVETFHSLRSAGHDLNEHRIINEGIAQRSGRRRFGKKSNSSVSKWCKYFGRSRGAKGPNVR